MAFGGIPFIVDAFSQYILIAAISYQWKTSSVYIKFLGMADSQNMLVTLQFYLLKIRQRIVIKQVNMGFIFFKRLNPNGTKFYPKTYSIQILE